MHPRLAAPTPHHLPLILQTLPELELQLKRFLMHQCVNAFIGTPFHIGLPLAFLELLELEIQDLTVLMEAKSAKGPFEDFRIYLMMGQGQKSVS